MKEVLNAVEIKYLFLDVEWYKPSKESDVTANEIIQLAAIATAEDFKITGSFSEVAKPKNLKIFNSGSCAFAGVTIDRIHNAYSIEKCFELFFKKFHKFNNLVIWNINAYNVFKYTAEKYGYKLPKHNVIVLQDFIKNNFKYNKKNKSSLSFQAILTKMNIGYKENRLHHAKYDVALLFDLFKKVFFRCIKKCKNNEFVYTKNSKVLHFTDCKSTKRINENNKEYTNRLALFDGFRLCEDCLKKRRLERFNFSNPIVKTKMEVLTDEYIENTCKFFKVKHHISIGVVFVDTNFSRWRVYFDDEKITNVFHENTRLNKHSFKRKLSLNDGFHLQKLDTSTFFNVVRYIKYHDEYKYSTIKSS